MIPDGSRTRKPLLHISDGRHVCINREKSIDLAMSASAETS